MGAKFIAIAWALIFNSCITYRTPRLPEKAKNSPFALHMKISISGGEKSGIIVDMDDRERETES